MIADGTMTDVFWPAPSMQLPIILLLMFTRVTCVVMTAPIFGSLTVPIKIRLLLAVFFSVAAFPLCNSSISMAPNPAELLTAVSSELVIGILLGLGVSILFAAAQAAGSVIGQLAGVQWPTQADTESGEPISAVSQLFAVLSLAAFALVGGPEMVLGSLLESCVHLPLGTSLNNTNVIALLTELLRQSFLLTLRGVGPAVAALMISTIVVGLIGRAYPQMNMFGLGLSSNQLILFLAISLTMGGSVWLFVDDLSELVGLIQSRLKEMG